MVRASCLVGILVICAHGLGEVLPRAEEPVRIVLPDFGAELRVFDMPEKQPVSWSRYIVNAGWGGGRGGPERRGGWLDKNYPLIDYLDRSADYTSHEYLKHRGIWYEVYGSNEYQETIHFHEEGARKLFWDNGIARDMNGERVLSAHYNLSVPYWREKAGFNAFIVCNNAPRWSAVINYDWLTSPLLGYAISQDNIGGPTSRIGAGGHGRYCDFCNLKFFHYLKVTNRLPEFRAKYKHIRDYVRGNLMDVIRSLPPYTKRRYNAEETELFARLCAPPVMSEYQKFLYISHLHNLMRYYKDAKLLAERVGREYDVHGNQGGGFVGPNPYQIALADFVDTVWFESNGLSAYDIFEHGWYNAWGAFRFEMCWAMTRGKKPFMCMTGFRKHTRDLVEHELAEECAGGGILFVNQQEFENEPQLLKILTDYFTFRHQHRAIFTHLGKRRHAQIALAYSIPTMMYYAYQYTVAEPINAMSAVARALEEGHLPFDVVIFKHPEIHADSLTLEDLKRYRLIILPALECLSDSQIALFTEYLKEGGTIGVIGKCGVRDENNIPRKNPPLKRWRAVGKVVDILPEGELFSPRVKENESCIEVSRRIIESVRQALGGETILSGEVPRMVWVKTWRHWRDFVSVHFVNYRIDFESGEATPTRPMKITLRMPPDIPAEEAIWLTPDGGWKRIPFEVKDGVVSLTVPALRVYGVLVVGRMGLDARRSAILQGDALFARARMACDGKWEALAEDARKVEELRRKCVGRKGSLDEAREYASTAAELLSAVQAMLDRKYIERLNRMVETDGAFLCLDFGAENAPEPWKPVLPDTQYSPERGFGWLPFEDDSKPTPEEIYYAMAKKHGGRFVAGRTVSRLLFYPYRTPPPAPLRMNISSGSRHKFRVDVPRGDYEVRVVTTNPSWMNRNFLVSGMVSVNGAVKLLDAPHDKGTLLMREFTASAPDGRLDFTFGGATGWGIAALVIKPVAAEVKREQVRDILTWRVSPRYANPDWFPIAQVVCPPEKRIADPPDEGWTEMRASRGGFPVVDLGSNRDADVGDIVYAVARINSPSAEKMNLHFGCSSQAQLWLNGKFLAYVPNEKGVRRDELVVPVNLKAGENVLVVKMERFWERRWMFYARLTNSP